MRRVKHAPAAKPRENENPVVHFSCDIPRQLHEQAKLACVFDGATLTSKVVELFTALAAKAPKLKLKG